MLLIKIGCVFLSLLLQSAALKALGPHTNRRSTSSTTSLPPPIVSPGILLPSSTHKRNLFANKNNDQHKRGGAIPSFNNQHQQQPKKFFTQSIHEQYRLRVEADPNFVSKSITEVFLAAATQLTAEINKRGSRGILIEIDFVVAGILTAIAGKYYSMWRTAPTATGKEESSAAQQFPTNAFQTDKSYTVTQRSLSFLVPIPALFRAGFIASALGYGLTFILILLRSTFIPSYEAATVNVNVLHACLYTGGFVAVVSNVRYQLLQGVIEPLLIEQVFRKLPVVKAILFFITRLANGLLGSSLAIAGMKMFGLQKRK